MCSYSFLQNGTTVFTISILNLCPSFFPPFLGNPVSTHLPLPVPTLHHSLTTPTIPSNPTTWTTPTMPCLLEVCDNCLLHACMHRYLTHMLVSVVVARQVGEEYCLYIAILSLLVPFRNARWRVLSHRRFLNVWSHPKWRCCCPNWHHFKPEPSDFPVLRSSSA